MRRNRLLLSSSLVFAMAAAACSSDSDSPPGTTGTPDAGFDSGVSVIPDAGEEVPDLGPPDVGFAPCNYDKGGFLNRGCDEGFVCNLEMDPPQCVPGKSCQTNRDCDPCSDLISPEECGHGYPLTAWCDPSHGNVCVRSKAPCETCNSNAECGFTHPLFNSEQQECIDYPGGERFCSRPSTFGCPDGFQADADGRCFRAGGCAAEPVICPKNDDPIPDCQGTGQICDGETCPDTGGARCSTNDQPGALGICIGFCESNADCPPQLPVCNQRNGICITPCTKGTCPAGRTCHADGFCAAPCNDNSFCENDPRYGPDTYCNVPVQPPPRYFKTYHDPNSCQALGCERAVDCGGAGRVCDPSTSPPTCVDGCYTTEDCASGELCKDAPLPPDGQNYSREQCRAFETLSDENEAIIGACCNPGCLDRNFQCGLNEWCCGEPDSPYEQASTCLSITSTGGRQAQPGECFELVDGTSAAGRNQWCSSCEPAGFNGRSAADECSSDARGMVPGPDGMAGWSPGLNQDPNVNNGNPFRELEFCNNVSIMGAPPLVICGTSCNPNSADKYKGCPGGQSCEPIFAPCCQNADCGGLECAGADCGAMPAVAGRCQCGSNGVPSASCPNDYALIDRTVPFPRCVESGSEGNLFCLSAYNCVPRSITPIPNTPSGFNYPTACFQ